MHFHHWEDLNRCAIGDYTYLDVYFLNDFNKIYFIAFKYIFLYISLSMIK